MTDRRRSRRAIIQGGAATLLATMAGCTASDGNGGASTDSGAGEESTGGAGSGTDTSADDGSTGGSGSDWRSMELTDVQTEESFTIQQFEGQQVVLETFAVWCSTCLRQQRQLGSARDQMDDLVPITVNIDPNEDVETVRNHLDEHDFDWRYVIADSPLTQSLIDDFGSVITTPPTAPIVRVCPDGDAVLIDQRGVKSVSDLQSAFDQC